MTEEKDRASWEAAASLLHYFAIRLEPGPDSDYPYSASDLISETSLVRILDRQAAALGHPERHVTGTLFAKRYSVWARGALAAFSLYDIPLDLTHENVKLRLADRGMMLYAAEPASREGLEGAERSTFAARYMDRLREHLAPIIKTVSACTGANETVMWSLVGHNTYSLYGSLTDVRSSNRLSLSPNRLELVLQDWKTLASAEPLGPAGYVEFQDPLWQGPPVYVRAYCCLAYRLAGKEKPVYCETCPKLTAESRRLLLSANKEARD
jgi:ferric iron reductase protein FhuF